MSRFTELMESEGFTFDESGMTASESKTLNTKFDDILNAIFTDILEKKSKSFRAMIDQGVKFDFSKSVKMPDEPIQIHYKDFSKLYLEDME